MCSSNPARVYIQYRCSQPLETVNTKRVQGLAIVCLGIFVSMLFLLTHWYLSETAVIDFKLWDVETVTASDFTVEYTITDEVWAQFRGTAAFVAM